MENQIVQSQPNAAEIASHYNKERIQQMLLMSDKLFRSECFGSDVKNEMQAFVKMQAGYEMGMAPVESLNSLYIIKGKVTSYGSAMTKRLRLHGWKLVAKELPNECEVTISKGGETYSYTATKEELVALKSQAAGFALKDKLFWHAVSRLIRRYVPEVMGGTVNYLTEEAEFIPEEKASVSVNSNTYLEIKERLETTKSLNEINAIKEDLKLIGSTLSNDEQKEIRELLIARLKELQPVVQPSTQETAPTSIAEATKETDKMGIQPDAATGEVIESPVPTQPAGDMPGIEPDQIEVHKEIDKVIADPPKPEKKWKKTFKGTTNWTPDVISNTIAGLKTHPEIYGFKEELIKLNEDGEITESVFKNAILELQNRSNNLWGTESKAQAEREQATIPQE